MGSVTRKLTYEDIVLVVDDDDGIRTSITDVLSDEGYNVAAVADGSEAIDYLRKHGRPCVILLDLWMPGMTGPEFRAEQLKDPTWAEIPVIVITAAGDGRERAGDLGATGFVQKPIDLQDLLTVVAEHCA